VVEKSIAQAVSSIYDGSPGLGADYSIDREAPLGLERRNGSRSALTKDTRVVGQHRMAQHRKSILNVANRFAAISLVIEPHESESRLIQEI
jgi:hypothetical protein